VRGKHHKITERVEYLTIHQIKYNTKHHRYKTSETVILNEPQIRVHRSIQLYNTSDRVYTIDNKLK